MTRLWASCEDFYQSASLWWLGVAGVWGERCLSEWLFYSRG